MSLSNINEDDKNANKDLPEHIVKSEDENKDRILENAENSVPPKASKKQKKAYDDAWENNKNQQLDDDF
jgi:hypothetical protein